MSKPLDRLALLETFVRIADAGSISAAARDLGLSQPSVSRQLAELEARFSAQLMRRTTHSLALTAAGAELLVDARRLLDDWEVLEEKHIESGEALRGQLKIIAPIALGQLHLVDVALQFQQQHPLISLSWQLQDDLIRFAEVGCDCWIKIGAVPDKSLLVEPLGQVERLVVASPQLLQTARPPKTPTALAKLPCVALAPFEGGQIPLTHQTGKTVVVSPAVKMVTNNIFALRQATLAGVGISVLPRWFITKELADQQLIDLLPHWRAPTLTIHVASLADRHQPRRLRSFLEVIKVAVPQIPGIF
ncbi:MAG: LysR family transcriptional regulator [Leptolyngbya sp. SIOISBB]|nr:LysR family transcriptional regulator [Leptolyngbya sp. SIOISBB]